MEQKGIDSMDELIVEQRFLVEMSTVKFVSRRLFWEVEVISDPACTTLSRAAAACAVLCGSLLSLCQFMPGMGAMHSGPVVRQWLVVGFWRGGC